MMQAVPAASAALQQLLFQALTGVDLFLSSVLCLEPLHKWCNPDTLAEEASASPLVAMSNNVNGNKQ